MLDDCFVSIIAYVSCALVIFVVSFFFFTLVYLLFDPDSEIDILNKHVFNTEAHPVKIFQN